MGTLTDIAIRKMKSAPTSFKRSDGAGLYLLVKPTGARLWRYDYRFAGGRRTLALGAWPEVSLAAARAKHKAARELLAAGGDPAEERKQQKRAAAAAGGRTFEAVALRWLAARRAEWTPRYAQTIENRLRGDLFPDLGGKDVGEIDPPLLLETLRRIEARGAIEAARRANSYVGQIQRFAIAEGLASRDASADIRGALKSKPPVQHHRALPAGEIGPFLVALAHSDEEPDTKDALMLTIYCATRTTETRFATAEEMERLDSDSPVWRIPPARMKMNLPHLVPLSRQAAEIVKRRVKRVGGKGLLFPRSTRSGTISENTMLYALYRLGYHSRATVHGFRGSFSTILNETTRIDDRGMAVRMFDSDWIERQLSHVEQNEVRGAYNAAEWIGPRRYMMQWWADWVDAQFDLARLIG